MSVSFLWIKKINKDFLMGEKNLYFLSFLQINLLNSCLSYVHLSFLSPNILLLLVNHFSISCYYWSFVHVTCFRDFLWRAFAVFVDILNRGGIIIQVVYHAHLVPGCRLVPPVVSGQRRSRFWQIRGVLILQENQPWERRNRLRKDVVDSDVSEDNSLRW